MRCFASSRRLNDLRGREPSKGAKSFQFWPPIFAGGLPLDLKLPEARTQVGLASMPYRLFYFLFFLSGANSLIYEVSWARSLSLFFGSDVYSATITLSVFMGGLALGSWLAGVWAKSCARPLAAYGLIEVAIGLAALAVPWILNEFRD